jgi:hypothetical protein
MLMVLLDYHAVFIEEKVTFTATSEGATLPDEPWPL